MSVGAILLVALGAYLFGSLPTGFLVARAKGIDIRAHGSGNIGASNVFRILGTPAGLVVLLTDALKGVAAVLLLPPLAARGWPETEIVTLRLVAAIGAVLGHNYTCWLRFKGGKGIATSAGVLAALAPPTFLVTVTTFCVVLAATRYVSLGSISAAAVLPVAAWITQAPRPIFWLATLLGFLAIWKHRSNLQRLLAGTERRLGQRAVAPQRPEPGSKTPNSPG